MNKFLDSSGLFLLWDKCKDKFASNDAVEKTENKTTSIDSSSTNSQYPSAKAVYDLIVTTLNTPV